MSADAEDVVRTLRMLIRNGEGDVACIEAYEEAADLIERQSAEIATLRAQVAALEEALKPFAEAAYSLDPKSPGGSSILDTYCAGLLCASDLRRARDVFNIDECSPTPAPNAPP